MIYTAGGVPRAAAQLLIQNSGTLTVTSAGDIRINDTGFENNGTFDAGTGTVEFTGTAATASSTIAGSGTITFYNLTLDKTTNDVQLNSNITVNNDLNFTTGNLQLNNRVVTLGTAAQLVGEAETKRAIGVSGGTIQTTRVLNAPGGLNPGNIGIVFTSTFNFGSTLIVRGHVPQLLGATNSIQRYFDVTPTNTAGLNFTLQFRYFDAELNGLTESTLALFRRVGGVFMNLGKDAHNTTLNRLTVNSVTQTGRFTLGNASSLPVEWVNFNATLNKQNEVVLDWTVTNEKDVAGYEVEKSTNGIDFDKLEFIPFKMTKESINHYTALDKSILNGIYYYRIRQIDLDGKYSYSSTQTISLKSKIKWQFFPNPAVDYIKIYMNDKTSDKITVKVFDAVGRLVLSRSFKEEEYVLDVKSLAKGLYSLVIETKKNTETSLFSKL